MTTLTARLQQQLRQHGPITFCEFMQQALYDPLGGYYQTTSEKIGRQGDYYTAANVDTIFGALLAQHCYQLQQELAITPLTLLEVGAGTGQLAADILTAWSQIAPANCTLRYLIWEPSPSLRAAQQAKLSDYLPDKHNLFNNNRSNLAKPSTNDSRLLAKHSEPPPPVTVEWIADLATTNPFTGIILANEVADALPVHCLRWQQDQLWELHVASHQEQFVAQWYPNTNPKIVNYLTTLQVDLLAGQTIEVGLAMLDWQQQLAQILVRGFLIIIDYGDLVDHLYSPEHFNGTLRGFSRHQLITKTADLLTKVSEQDITADVNFSALITYGAQYGLQTRSLLRQADYLIKLGLLDKLSQLMTNDITDLRRRLAWKNFFIPGGISDRFKVLVQEKLSD
jgi:SAM-dependent MidA family methyltransferase